MNRWWRGLALVTPLVFAECGGEAVPVDGHDRMVALLAELATQAARDNVFFGTEHAAAQRAELERLGDAAPWRLRLDVGVAELRAGREKEGIAILAAERKAMQSGKIAFDVDAAVAVSFHLGVGWMRYAETHNCCARPTTDTCILPLRGSGVHQDREGAQQAAYYFTEVLNNAGPTDYWHRSARWLLNLAHMALGSHPEGVPAQHRLPAELFAATGNLPRFLDAAPRAGLDTWGLAGGAVVDDFDGDELLDVVVTDWAPDGQMRYFRNRGDGTFADETAAAGLLGITGGLNLIHADYDGDGDLDLLVLRGAWFLGTGRLPNSLLQNDGRGRFRDVTFAAGLAEPFLPTQAAAFADYDLDGDLDLYIGNEHSPHCDAPSQLFRNNGDGTFTDVATAAGVQNLRYAKGVAWGDIDGDDDPDLYVSNIDGPNRLYENRGDGTFVDVAPERGVTAPAAGFPTWFFDYDNDGALDLLATNYDTGIGHVESHYAKGPLVSETMRLYRGDGQGGFCDVTRALGLAFPASPMGANFADVDGDGWLDFYLGTGDPQYYSLMPNLLLRNDGGRRFVDATFDTGTGHLQKGHGVAFADLDHDGDLDLFETLGGAYPGDAFRNVLFENPGNGHRWVALRLVGTNENRCAIGARVRVEFVEHGKVRRVYREVTSGGSFGGNPLRLTIGLGAAERITALEIRWPRRHQVQRFTDVPLDRLLCIVEDQPTFAVRELQPTRFGGR
jgi:hypothetical protein